MSSESGSGNAKTNVNNTQGQGTPASENEQNGGSGRSGRNQNRNGSGRGGSSRNGGSSRQAVVDPNLRSFEGAESDVGGVLCLSNEKVDKKVTFDEFRVKIGQYIERKYDNSDDIVMMVEDMKTPEESYKNSKPRYLTEAEKKSDESEELKIEYSYRLKKWIDCGEQLKFNKSKLFSLILGQCSDSLRSVV